MKINCILYKCKQYPINERVSGNLQRAFRKQQNLMTRSQCHTYLYVYSMYISVYRNVTYLGKDDEKMIDI